jgi:hypothetical protein
MTDSDQKEFLELLADLYGACGQNVKANIANGTWRGLKHMALSEFRAVVENSIETMRFTERGAARPPTVAEIWDRHREHTKSRGIDADPPAPKYAGDGWSVNANLLLLEHIRRATRPAELDYAPDTQGNPVHVGPHTEAIAKILAKWKNSWARDMREDREIYNGKREGASYWRECMKSADAEVAAYLARYVHRQEAA